ncbi:hypothetical protein [Streptomyces sp. NRRL F-2580]|uniref:hypothetical protein n=1 Tax=Streptomyces sp. NRRL F-2580 TaxID=1463841 RepID=UPI0004C79104|nr:hypothetical protein [Streptomyces sp. NRRL F-2580]
MTEILTEPQAPPEETTSTPAQPEADKPAPAKDVEHTPGGFPVVPLSLSGANTTAGLLAASALVGGPIAAAVAMTGAAVLGTAAVRRRSKTGAKKTAAKPSQGAGRTPGGSGGRGLLGRVPAQSRTAPRAGGGTGTRKAAGGQARHRAGGPAGARSGSTVGKTGSPSARQRAARAAAGLAGGRAGQLQALRSQARTQSPTRAAARAATVQARRQVADARRATKAAERAASTAAKPRGVAARTLAKGMGEAASVRDKAVGAVRSARDRSSGRAVAAGRQGVRSAAHRARVAQLKAPGQKAARKALLRSAARFQGRRALAALCGLLAGVVGLVTTPLGRKLGWAWLMHPGRRLYRLLAGRAEAEREARDEEIRARLDQDEKDAEQEAAAELEQDDEQQITDRVERPEGQVPAPPVSEGAHVMDSNTSGFRFEELAAEMEQAAQSYEPESAMEILAMIEGLPQALASIANIMQILAERSDSEFPLEKEVAGGFNDIYGAINSAIAVAEDLGAVFRQAHEADIARHEDPRNGPDAEKGWNV